MKALLTAQEAIIAAQKEIGEVCKEQGIAPLTGHDIAILAAWAPFERAYNRVASNLQEGQEDQFNRDVVMFAKKCIAQAILA